MDRVSFCNIYVIQRDTQYLMINFIHNIQQLNMFRTSIVHCAPCWITYIYMLHFVSLANNFKVKFIPVYTKVPYTNWLFIILSALRFLPSIRYHFQRALQKQIGLFQYVIIYIRTRNSLTYTCYTVSSRKDVLPNNMARIFTITNTEKCTAKTSALNLSALNYNKILQTRHKTRITEHF